MSDWAMSASDRAALDNEISRSDDVSNLEEEGETPKSDTTPDPLALLAQVADYLYQRGMRYPGYWPLLAPLETVKRGIMSGGMPEPKQRCDDDD